MGVEWGSELSEPLIEWEHDKASMWCRNPQLPNPHKLDQLTSMAATMAFCCTWIKALNSSNTGPDPDDSLPPPPSPPPRAVIHRRPRPAAMAEVDATAAAAAVVAVRANAVPDGASSARRGRSSCSSILPPIVEVLEGRRLRWWRP